MAGYILKIVIEDTHPPVWRRIMVPDHITFADLHNMIQLVVVGEDVNLHDFSIRMDHKILNKAEKVLTRGVH